MASKDSGSNTRISDTLFNKPKSFDFYQALRVLQQLSQNNDKPIRYSSSLGLSFKGNQIESIEEDAKNYHMVLNFLGLYNADSPLPTYYVEELIANAQEGNNAAKDFLDIFQQRLYQLYFEAWEKNNLAYQLYVKHNTNLRQVIYNMAGISIDAASTLIQRQPRLKKYLNYFMPSSRNLMNLQNLLSDYFNVQVKVQSYYKAVIAISVKQRNKLGLKCNTLGNNCYLGQFFNSVSSNILINVATLPRKQYQEFLPGKVAYENLAQILQYYLNQPLNCYLCIRLSQDDMMGDTLGAKDGNYLGQESWLGEPLHENSHCVTMKIEYLG